MKVNVRLFAGLKELLGGRELVLDLTDGATIGDLRDALSRDYPIVTPFLTTLVCAVQEEYVPSSHRLRDGDEVALIPPVSGGGGRQGIVDDAGWFLVTEQPLDQQALVDFVRRDESGAVALFFGVARNLSEGKRVLALEYDAYPSMAQKKLREVAIDARERWPLTSIGAFHRVGRLEIGEASLLVAVSSAHRAEAFAACQYAVDRIKQVVPVWKKEIFEDGSGAWVAGYAVDEPEPAGPARQSR
jgi:molybdopterin synthase catalytic subunit